MDKKEFEQMAKDFFGKRFLGEEVMLKNGCQKRVWLIELIGDSNMKAIFYVDDAFECVKRGENPIVILANFAKGMTENQEEMAKVATRNLKEMPLVRYLIKQKGNEEYLQTLYHEVFLDLAIVYRIMIDENASMILTKEIFQSTYNSKEELEAQLVEYPTYNEPLFGDMFSVLFERKELGGSIDKNGLNILSNKEKHFGSGALLHEAQLKDIGDTLECDYYILPSSIHEVLFLPVQATFFESKEEAREELTMMVREVNRDQVAPEEQLSDEVYYFNRETGKIEIL